ncbi:hypothetical protein ACG83_17635 [Frankia sp. R43]|nr:hypothetical protein ACG83_17635 [Frankia sp. R43]
MGDISGFIQEAFHFSFPLVSATFIDPQAIGLGILLQHPGKSRNNQREEGGRNLGERVQKLYRFEDAVSSLDLRQSNGRSSYRRLAQVTIKVASGLDFGRGRQRLTQRVDYLALVESSQLIEQIHRRVVLEWPYA